MKKSFKFYAIGWALLFALFNAIIFLIPAWPTLEKYTPSFWIGFSVANVAMLGQLVCAWITLRDGNPRKTFYNLSSLGVSYAGLFITVFVGLFFVAFSPLPGWIAAIICPLVLIANIFAAAKVRMAVEIIAHIDEKVKNATAFIYDMRAESESLIARAKTDEAKAICKKISDAFKYSDPMSKEELASIDYEIRTSFDLLKLALKEDQMTGVESESEELLALMTERNNKCKRLK